LSGERVTDFPVVAADPATPRQRKATCDALAAEARLLRSALHIGARIVEGNALGGATEALGAELLTGRGARVGLAEATEAQVAFPAHGIGRAGRARNPRISTLFTVSVSSAIRRRIGRSIHTDAADATKTVVAARFLVAWRAFVQGVSAACGDESEQDDKRKARDHRMNKMQPTSSMRSAQTPPQGCPQPADRVDGGAPREPTYR
jgi:hypothetical protein